VTALFALVPVTSVTFALLFAASFAAATLGRTFLITYANAKLILFRSGFGVFVFLALLRFVVFFSLRIC